MLVRDMARWVMLALSGIAYPSAAVGQAAEIPAAIPQDDPHDVASSRPARDPQAIESPQAAESAIAGGFEAPAEETSAGLARVPSDAVTRLKDLVISSGDNQGLPFIIIDKVAADLFVHAADGALVATAPALLGVTIGDDSAPGVGDRELSEISPEERTTPAGRFVAKLGPASGNRNVLWVDIPTAISLHPVVTGKKQERRLERLESPTGEDNRITYGCINVPAAFYANVVQRLFEGTSGVVYILPETAPLDTFFVAFRTRAQSHLNPATFR